MSSTQIAIWNFQSSCVEQHAMAIEMTMTISMSMSKDRTTTMKQRKRERTHGHRFGRGQQQLGPISESESKYHRNFHVVPFALCN